jgi:hypothetical protein
LGQLWIKDIAYNLDHDLLHEYFRLWIAIQSTQLHLHDSREDEMMWTLEGSGKYPASSEFAGQVLKFSKANMERLGTAVMRSIPLAPL